MSDTQRGFSVVEGVIVVAALAALSLFGWLSWRTVHQASSHPASASKQTASAPSGGKVRVLLAEIRDSGSTNASGWDLQIYTDGSGALIGTTKTFRSKTFDVGPLKQALDSTDLSSFQDTCARSASFGTVQTLLYAGRATKGIDCYIDTNPTTPLAAQLSDALERAGL